MEALHRTIRDHLLEHLHRIMAHGPDIGQGNRTTFMHELGKSREEHFYPQIVVLAAFLGNPHGAVGHAKTNLHDDRVVVPKHVLPHQWLAAERDAILGIILPQCLQLVRVQVAATQDIALDLAP